MAVIVLACRCKRRGGHITFGLFFSSCAFISYIQGCKKWTGKLFFDTGPVAFSEKFKPVPLPASRFTSGFVASTIGAWSSWLWAVRRPRTTTPSATGRAALSVLTRVDHKSLVSQCSKSKLMSLMFHEKCAVEVPPLPFPGRVSQADRPGVQRTGSLCRAGRPAEKKATCTITNTTIILKEIKDIWWSSFKWSLYWLLYRWALWGDSGGQAPGA